MERVTDPAHFRVGINIGSPEDAALSTKLMQTMDDLMGRVLNLTRLLGVASPIIVQCFYIHTVDLGSWILRLLVIYALIGGISFVAMPEQLYNGMGLSTFRWLFERYYPDAIHTWGHAAADAQLGLLQGMLRPNDLAGVRCHLRWHGTSKFLCIDQDGWAVPGDESFAVQLLLQHVFVKEKQAPDTYTFRIMDPAVDWHQCWLSFSAVNHLRFGGWLGAYRDQRSACPYKIIQDSSCPPGTCKLLCAWMNMPTPSQRFCTGFYLSEQLSGRRPYVGHAPDRDAALFELLLA
mmetsp:Transcript_59502/g.166180  ORF Transcript_59502/g.166180 Transcript_59502/m.166180 type:complete len:291 (-) Transcript_59502:164-1036(-)